MQTGKKGVTIHNQGCISGAGEGGILPLVSISFPPLKVLNHASRTLPRFPYTNLKKSRTEKKLVTEHDTTFIHELVMGGGGGGGNNFWEKMSELFTVE